MNIERAGARRGAHCLGHGALNQQILLADDDSNWRHARWAAGGGGSGQRHARSMPRARPARRPGLPMMPGVVARLSLRAVPAIRAGSR